MINRMFNHINLMQKSLDASWMRQEVISQNIANADTPGYDAKHVEFEEAFSRALSGNDNFKNNISRSKHINFNGTDDPLAVQPTIVSNDHFVMRMDDNNVDPDKEMVDMAKNTIQYNAMIQKVNKEFANLKYVIREGR